MAVGLSYATLGPAEGRRARAKRRADYVLSGLILRAEERGLTAEAGVVHGAVGVELVRESESREGAIVWSDFAVPTAKSGND